MSGTAGALLAVLIVGMIGIVVFLVRLDARKERRTQLEQAASLGLSRAGDASRLASIDFLWRRAAMRRSAHELWEGRYGGWDVRVFLFANIGDLVTSGVRAGARVVASGLPPVPSLALDWRTAQQRGVLVAVDYAGEPATFKIRLNGNLVARNEAAARLLGGNKVVRLRCRVPPARCVLRDGWFHLASYYVLPKWLASYVQASTEICRTLDPAAVRPRDDSELPAPLF